MVRLRGIDAADHRRGKGSGNDPPDSSSEWPSGGRMAISQDGVITRRRLLPFGSSASPITLVSAPAGYGKTTLLQQWAPDTGGPVVRLDPVETTDSWQLWRRIT